MGIFLTFTKINWPKLVTFFVFLLYSKNDGFLIKKASRKFSNRSNLTISYQTALLPSSISLMMAIILACSWVWPTPVRQRVLLFKNLVY